MKIFRFLFFLIVGVTLVLALNTQMGGIPPIGKTLSPFHGFWCHAEKVNHYSNECISNLPISVASSVVFDSNMVPHIYAENEEDLFFMQGYVTAKMRLWQMDMQVKASAGRLSEVLGADLLEFDREQRRMGMTYAAEQTLAACEQDPNTMKMLEAYSSGVNHYIDQLRARDIPLEYKLMGFEPEHWSPYKTCLLLKRMSLNLTGTEYDLENTAIREALGQEMFDQLFPDNWGDKSPIVPSQNLVSETQDSISNVNAKIPKVHLPDFLEPKERMIIGSNNWAVSGDKTASGHPYLANDPHLGLSLPAIWFEIGLHCPTLQAYGVTIPGAPAVLLGFNEKAAWGVTNAGRDVKDWYNIENSNTPNQYMIDGESRPFDLRIETISIKDSEDFIDTVRYTHFGPIVYDRSFQSTDEIDGYALKWSAHRSTNDPMAFYLLNKAHSHDDYLNALSYYECPGQNFVFANQEGDIAIKQQGAFPIRPYNSGKFLQDGTTSNNDWQGFVPFDENPHSHNPERGFVSSANQHPTDSSYSYGYHGIFEAHRNTRINYRLDEMENITLKDMMDLQYDSYHQRAKESLPIMLDYLDDGENSEFVQVLSNWDFFTLQEEKAPTMYYLWYEALNNLLFDELSHIPPSAWPSFESANRLLHQPDHILFDLIGTEKIESAQDICRQSFKMAFDEYENLSNIPNWGDFRSTGITHLALIPAFSWENVQSPGAYHGVVNATGPKTGPSWRMIVHLSDPIEAYAIYPAGQSGNPGSYHYDNMIEPWKKGEYHRVFFHTEKEAFQDEFLFEITATP